MTFYNPNIQRFFDEENSVGFDLLPFIQPRSTLASYSFIYDYNSMCSNSYVSRYPISTNLALLFQSDVQHQNLLHVDSRFSHLFCDIVLNVYRLHLKSFSEYVCYLKSLEDQYAYNDIIEINECIIDFIELLVYSDIASSETTLILRDFTKLLGNRTSDDSLPIYNTLYDRLKLYADLFNVLRLGICNVHSSYSSSIIRFDLVIYL